MAQVLGARAGEADECDRISCRDDDYCVIRLSPLMSGKSSEQNVEQHVFHYLMDALHGAYLVLAEQGMFGSEHKESLDPCHEDGFHLRLRGEDERTVKANALGLIGVCRDDR